MTFVVLPALVSDISEVYDAYFAAFKDSAVTRALFPTASAEDMTDPASAFRKAHTSHVSQYWSRDSTQYTLKCVDSETGKIVGMALWDIYLTPSKWSRPGLSWLEGHDKERAEKLIAPLWDAREKYWLGERYLYCHVIAVHPAYQRRGVGQMLLKYGIDVAHQTKLPIYIESSRDGTRLYEKMGCRKLRTHPGPQAELSMSENCAGKGNNEATLFVWCPKSGEGTLPKGIELA